MYWNQISFLHYDQCFFFYSSILVLISTPVARLLYLFFFWYRFVCSVVFFCLETMFYSRLHSPLHRFDANEDELDMRVWMVAQMKKKKTNSFTIEVNILSTRILQYTAKGQEAMPSNLLSMKNYLFWMEWWEWEGKKKQQRKSVGWRCLGIKSFMLALVVILFRQRDNIGFKQLRKQWFLIIYLFFSLIIFSIRFTFLPQSYCLVGYDR